MMTLVILLGILALAVLTPLYGADSRDLSGRPEVPPPEDKLWSRQA